MSLTDEQKEEIRLERLRSLPADGAKIRMSMLDSKSDLKDLIDDCERFRDEGP